MIRRKGIPDGGCSMCCRLKQKLDELWQRTSGCILRIRGITPDGQGDFALEAGQNVNISEVPNGLKISTTGGVSYYEPADGYVTIDNDTLEIGVNAGVQDGLATQNDLETVASAVTNIIDGTTQVADAAHADSADSATSAGSATNATNATNAQYIGSSSTNVGDNTVPIKIVNGQPVAGNKASYGPGDSFVLGAYRTFAFGYVNFQQTYQFCVPISGKITGSNATLNGTIQVYLNDTQIDVTLTNQSAYIDGFGLYFVVASELSGNQNKMFVARTGTDGVTVTIN